MICAAGRGVILMCEIGGTMTPSENFPYGKLSRSLKGAFNLLVNDGMELIKVSTPALNPILKCSAHHDQRL